MLSSSVSVVALFITLTLAFNSPNPSQTAAHQNVQESTPQPTTPPLLTHELLRRQSDASQTCGYFNGNANSVLTCEVSSACAFSAAPNNYFGCCSTSGDDCYDVGACVPAKSASSLGLSVGGGPQLYSNSVICGTGAPNCATTYISGVPSYTGTHTHFDCVASSSVYYLAWNPATTQTSQASQAVTTKVEISVSVVQITVHDTPTSTTVTSTVGSSSSSSATSSSASAATTTSGADGMVYRADFGLAGLAVVAGFFGM